MAKHRIGSERRTPRISYLSHSPNEGPEIMMSLDESETLLGPPSYVTGRGYATPDVTVLEVETSSLSLPYRTKKSPQTPSSVPTAAIGPQSMFSDTIIYLKIFKFSFYFHP